MIYIEKPQNFEYAFESVGCFLERDGKILLLHRQDHKPYGNTWGIPSGKVDNGEIVLDAMIREIKEETGYSVSKDQIKHHSKVYVEYPEYNFVYHIFHSKLNSQDQVKIHLEEHKNFKWTLPTKALDMNLIKDLDSCIHLFYGI